MSWTLITRRNSRKKAQKAQKNGTRMDTNKRERKTDEPQIDADGQGASKSDW